MEVTEGSTRFALLDVRLHEYLELVVSKMWEGCSRFAAVFRVSAYDRLDLTRESGCCLALLGVIPNVHPDGSLSAIAAEIP